MSSPTLLMSKKIAQLTKMSLNVAPPRPFRRVCDDNLWETHREKKTVCSVLLPSLLPLPLSCFQVRIQQHLLPGLPGGPFHNHSVDECTSLGMVNHKLVKKGIISPPFQRHYDLRLYFNLDLFAVGYFLQ